MTLNGVMALILRYFTEFSCKISSQNNYKAYLGFKMGIGAGLYMYDVVVKGSRSLSHLLMSSCLMSKISAKLKRGHPKRRRQMQVG